MVEIREFELTEEHIKLLSRMYTCWDDRSYGHPSMCANLYGNSDVFRDMAEILGTEEKLCPHCSEIINEIDQKWFDKLHEETPIALEIVLRTKSFRPGIYVRDWPERNWRLKTKEE